MQVEVDNQPGRRGQAINRRNPQRDYTLLGPRRSTRWKMYVQYSTWIGLGRALVRHLLVATKAEVILQLLELPALAGSPVNETESESVNADLAGYNMWDSAAKS